MGNVAVELGLSASSKLSMNDSRVYKLLWQTGTNTRISLGDLYGAQRMEQHSFLVGSKPQANTEYYGINDYIGNTSKAFATSFGYVGGIFLHRIWSGTIGSSTITQRVLYLWLDFPNAVPYPASMKVYLNGKTYTVPKNAQSGVGYIPEGYHRANYVLNVDEDCITPTAGVTQNVGFPDYNG